mgnify:CR=1 FL=1
MIGKIQKAKAAALFKVCGAAGHGGAAAIAGGQRAGHGRPLLLQISLPTGRAGRRPSPLPDQCRHPRRAGQAVHMESLHSAGSHYGQRGVLPPLLQVAVPAGRVLCAAEQGLAVPDARRHPQMRLLRSLCKGLQDGRRHYQDPQPRRMHPLRDVHESLPHGRHSVQVRAGGPIKYRNNKGVKP